MREKSLSDDYFITGGKACQYVDRCGISEFLIKVVEKNAEIAYDKKARQSKEENILKSDRLKKLICLLLCVALSLVLIGCGKSEEPEETPEPEIIEELPEETAATPEPEPVKEPALPEGAEQYPAVLASLRHMLYNNTDDIRMYSWQYPRHEEPAAAVVWDIGGDESPELLYIATREHDYSYDVWPGELEIWTYADFQPVKVMSEVVDMMSASAAHYCIFQKEGSRNLFLYRVLNGETICVEYMLSGTYLQPVRTLKSQTRVVNLYPRETTLDYTDNGEAVEQEEFEKRIAEMLQGMKTVLLRSAFLEDVVLEAGAADLEAESTTPAVLYGLLSEALEVSRVRDGEGLQAYPGQWVWNANYLNLYSVDTDEVSFSLAIHRLHTYQDLVGHWNETGDAVFTDEETGLAGTLTFYRGVIVLQLEEAPKGYGKYSPADNGNGKMYVFAYKAS